MRRESIVALLALLITWVMPATARAQAPAPAATTAPQDDPYRDLQIVTEEPDFTLGVLPTTLRMPQGKFNFRVTHRFTYAINDGSFGEFFENFFGLDSSATTGFELRYGVVPGTQLSIHRTGNRNIQLLAQHQLVEQARGGPVSFDLLAGVEGQNNFREEFSMVAGGVVSRRLTDRGALYLEPIVVLNATPELPASDENALVLGLGARIRVISRTYLIAEFAPRVSGYDGGTSVVTFGLEKRKGGHMFQLNVSNAFGTTLTQVGQGGPVRKDWQLGFNLTRKFY